MADAKRLASRFTSAEDAGTQRERPTGIIKSAARALRILRGLMRAPQARSLTEISAHHGLHKTTALRLLRTLTAEGIVARDQAGRYASSPRFLLALDPFVGSARSLIADVQETLDRLARETGGTALVLLPDETERRVYAPVFGLPPGRVLLDPTATEPVPLHTTASGKCYLAALTGRRLTDHLDHGLPAAAPGPLASSSALKKELQLVRKQGYALNRDEAVSAFPGAAVPLRGPDGEVVGGLGLALFAGTGGLDRAVECIPRIQSTAERVSELLSDRSWGARVAALGLAHYDRASVWDGPEVAVLDGPEVLVRSVSRVIRAMAVIIRPPAGVSAGELMDRRHLDRSTVRRLLRTLESRELVRRDATTRRYRAHPLMWLRLASALRASAPLRESTLRILRRLSDRFGATVSLSVIDVDGRHTVPLQYALPARPAAYHPGRGSLPALHATASGKCLLAHRSRFEAEHYLADGLQAYTENTITSPARLMQELAATRKAGFAVSREEFVSGIGGVAVPVATLAAGVFAALAVAPLIGELTEPGLREWLPQLRAAASSLSGMLGPDWREHLATEQP